jgi:phage/plasmid-like protein (TIGR03299 family)
MAHMIDSSAGRPAFAFGQADGEAWHGLGVAIPEEAAKDPAKIAELAGAAYTVTKEAAGYMSDGKFRKIDNRVALVRSDTGAALEILSDNRYKIVQPIEYFEAFRDALAANNLSISAAGVLQGGRKVFVTAKLDREFAVNVMDVDPSESYMVIGGGYDGNLASFGYLSTFRTICWNTLSANLSQSKAGGKLFRVPHYAAFDGKAMGNAIGLAGKEVKVRADVFNVMARRTVRNEERDAFFKTLLGIKDDDKLSPQKQGKLEALYEAFANGPGAQLPSAKSTVYGLVNAVSFYTDHLAGTRDTTGDGVDKSRFASAQFGAGAQLKAKALKQAMALANIGEELLIAA